MAGHAYPPHDPTIQEDAKSLEWRAKYKGHLPAPGVKSVTRKPRPVRKETENLPAMKSHCKTTYRLKSSDLPCTNDEHCKCVCKSCSDMRVEKPWDPSF